MAMERVVSLNIVQCLIHSAFNCMHARSLLEERYPHLLVGPCAPHSLELAMENIAGGRLVGSILQDMREVVKYFCIHGGLNVEFKSWLRRWLLLPVDARLKTVHIMLGCALEVRSALQQCCFSSIFQDLLNQRDSVRCSKAEAIRAICVDSATWEQAKCVVHVGTPIV